MRISTDSALLKGKKTKTAAARYHFIGAGGIGMSGLAKILLANKAKVSGSDQTQSPVTDKLNQAGAKIKIGHHADNFDPDTDIVVMSAAVKEDNPELIAARQAGCKIYKYAEMLGILMDSFDGLAISGTHGKSTTGGWLVYILKQAGIDVNFVIGADISQFGTNSDTGESGIFVAEACEYDRSFWNLRPKVAAILNVEADHLDVYGSEENVVAAFEHFAAGVKSDGVVIANATDANIRKIIDKQPQINFETFGLDESCDCFAKDIKLEDGFYSFDYFYNRAYQGRARLGIPGRHNILNALAVVSLAVQCGLDPKAAVGLLGEFSGIDRRLTERGTFCGVTVIDDYAHHPTEIRASLEALRNRYEPERLVCVYQPHQYSRTRFLLDDFAKSFYLADITIVPGIYFVRDEESAKRQISARMLVERICESGAKALFVDGFADTCEYLQRMTRLGDLVVIMGAGDIWKVTDEYIQRLGKNS